jgi:hypothetical protein
MMVVIQIRFSLGLDLVFESLTILEYKIIRIIVILNKNAILFMGSMTHIYFI